MDNLCWAPIDATINIVLSAMFYAPAFAITCLVNLVISPRTFREYFRRVAKLALFVVLLLLAGAFFTCIWGATIWGWLYRSTDYCGNDFFPFVPIGRAALDAPFGNEPHGLLHGTTLLQLRLIWLLFALCTWGSTLLLYRLLSRKCFSNGSIS
jgi:hypothetical protein